MISLRPRRILLLQFSYSEIQKLGKVLLPYWWAQEQASKAGFRIAKIPGRRHGAPFEWLQQARFPPNHFLHIYVFIPYNSATRSVWLLSPVRRWVNWRTQRLSNFTTVITQEVAGPRFKPRQTDPEATGLTTKLGRAGWDLLLLICSQHAHWQHMRGVRDILLGLASEERMSEKKFSLEGLLGTCSWRTIIPGAVWVRLRSDFFI